MVNLRPVLFVIGLVLSKLALFMYVPTLVAFFTGTGGFLDFAQAVVITHLAAFICLTIGRTAKFKLSVRDMFLITSLVWTIASAFAALPFVFINHISSRRLLRNDVGYHHDGLNGAQWPRQHGAEHIAVALYFTMAWWHWFYRDGGSSVTYAECRWYEAIPNRIIRLVG